MKRILLFSILLLVMACRQGLQQETMLRVANLTSDWARVGQQCLNYTDSVSAGSNKQASLDSLYKVWLEDQKSFDAWRNTVTAGEVKEQEALEALKEFEEKYKLQKNAFQEMIKSYGGVPSRTSGTAN